MTLLNHKEKIEDIFFKLSLVSFTSHTNGYLDRDIDVLSRNELRVTNGLTYRYNCKWPYKNYI